MNRVTIINTISEDKKIYFFDHCEYSEKGRFLYELKDSNKIIILSKNDRVLIEYIEDQQKIKEEKVIKRIYKNKV